MFSLYKPMQTCDPRGRAILGDNLPQGDNLNKLGRGPLGDVTY